MRILDTCRALLAATAIASMVVACAPKPAGAATIQATLERCMGAEFPHLMGVAFAGAIDPDYAEQARTGARTCKGATADLKRLKAPEACIATAQDMETLHWKLSRVLGGQADDTWPDGLQALMGLADSCAQAANFPKPPPSPDADGAHLAAESARKEAEKAATAADEAQKAALEAMSQMTK